MNKQKLIASLKIIRIPNSIMMGIAVIIGLQISNPKWFLLTFPTLFGDYQLIYITAIPFLVGFFLSASSMVFNDYVDYEIDLINFPKKPIPAGLIRRDFALYYAIILAIIGLFLAFSLANFNSLIIALSGIIIAYLYNLFLKKRGIVGNMAVAYTTILPFLYGASLMNFQNFFPLFILCLLAFLSNLSREIVKGIVDIIGDRALGIKTIANTRGQNFASKLAFYLISVAVVISFTPFFLGYLNIYFIPILLLADIIFIYYSLILLRNPSKENAYRTKNRYLIAMSLALLCFFLASI
ncbi:MAG: UbiA family prenyltransferase [Thermoproteota archaeon]|jgi:geranylgeranylglycerol-phosphate geranylgeranyltransferase|nr:UbiA family prenyltransferase [Thermoproteota archaeon]